jgi:hypothetical protein
MGNAIACSNLLRGNKMLMLNERIQIEVLGRLANNPHRDVFRGEIASVFNVSGSRVDQVMARCSLVKRVTANGGAHVRYRFAD